jgi:hypothetical protein
MSLEEIFADVKKEGSDPFEQFDKEKETPAESQPEKEQEKEESVADDVLKDDPKEKINTEENSPFHIRWQKREEKLKAEFEEKLEVYKKELEQTIEDKTKQEDSNIPEWFTELYGDNQVAWSKYEQREKAREEEIEKRVLTAYETKQQEQVDQSKKWEKWVDDQVELLENEGKKFDRNELIKTVLDYRPTDEQGNFDLRKGYDIMEALKGKQDAVKTQASLERKKIADTTSKAGGGDSPKKDYMTPSDLRNKSWNQI